MKISTLFSGTVIVTLLSSPVLAVNCAKNPSHPNCAEPPSSAVTIDSVIIDRVDSEIEINGSGLSGASATLAGSAIPADLASNDSILLLPFGSELSSAVTTAGNYVLDVDGLVLAIYVDGEIPDSSVGGCPCGDFNSELDAAGLFANAPAGSCVEVGTEITSGILDDSYPVDFSSPPLYVIGAAFVNGDPGSSVCRMAEVDAGGESNILVEPVDATQQAACATLMKANPRICGP